MEQQFQNMQEYKVNLDVFEGPLDLLLYLIKKNDLDLADIPIAIITEEYLKYIDAWKDLNVNIAGEYLLMAAELIQMKSKILLPDPEGEDELLEDDPRAELQRRLLEYQRYKDAANAIFNRSVLMRDEYVQLSPEGLPGREEILVQENAYILLEAFQTLLKKIPSNMVQEVTIDRISVNERIFQLVELIKTNETLSLDAVLPKVYAKHDLVITFLALLEMSKLMMIKVFQAGQFQTIYITGTMEKVDRDEALKLVASEEEKLS